MKRQKLASVALLVLGLISSACGGSPAAPPVAQSTAAPAKTPGPAATAPATSAPAVIKIGIPTPITGAGAPTGAWAKLANEIAAEIINNAHPDLDLPLAATSGLPNLGGAKIEFVYGDSEGKPEKGAAEAERLITVDKVVALSGVGFSGVAAAIQPIEEKYGIPHVEGMASSPSLTTGQFKWFFRVTPHDVDYSRTMFLFLKDLEKRGVATKRIAVLYEDTIFGKDSAAAQKKFAQEAGYEVVADIQYRKDTLDFTGEIQRLKTARPDVLLPTSYVNDAILIYKTMKQLDFAPAVVLAQDSGFEDANFLKAVGKDADGLLSRAAWAGDLKKTQLAKVFEIARKVSGRTDVADLFAAPVAGQITAILTLADAINRAGSTDPAKIRQALLATDVPGSRTIMPWERIKFDASTQQNAYSTAAIVQRLDGKFSTVWPDEQSTKTLMYPFPSWSKR